MTDPLKHYEKEFEGLRQDQPPWVGNLHARGMEAFRELGFPNSRQEEWRFTNLAPLLKERFYGATERKAEISSIEEIDPLACWSFHATRIVFVNGHFAPELSSLSSLPAGVTVLPLSEALTKEPILLKKILGGLTSSSRHPFVQWNTAFFSDGAFVHLSKRVTTQNPIQILCYNDFSDPPVATHPRHVIFAEEGSRATLLESYLGRGKYLTNAVTEIFTGPNAFIDHYKLQEEARDAFHAATIQTDIGRQSRFVSHSVSIGGGWVRNDINATLAEEGAACSLDGLYMADGEQQVDHHTSIDHVKPHGTSGELYKGILGGRSRAVFNGKIIVRPEAQKTNAKQANRNLLLSDDAQINTKPLLEINADDVKCNHGATIGRLDENQVFYLRSRGIADPQARGLLVCAFANEMVDRMKLNPLKAFLSHFIFKQLEGA